MNSKPTRFGKIWPPFRFCMALIAATGFGLASPKRCLADCSTVTPNTPLNDLGQGTYYPTGSPSPSPSTTPVQGGLYPGGSNQRPATHNSDGLSIAQNKIFPRKLNGDPDPNGTDPNSKIIMISIGMCNALMEFAPGDDPQAFIPRARNDSSLNPKLTLINCAQAGMDAAAWAGSTGDLAWTKAIDLVDDPAHGTSVNQVQVVWLKQALIFDNDSNHPPLSTPFPNHAKLLQGDLEQILRNIRTVFPKVRIAYLSPRTYAYTRTFHSPEPKAYETGFAVKWTIQEQIENPNGTIGYKGNSPAAPWICWGPYLWTNGTVETNGIKGRSDGLTWECGVEGQDPNDVRHVASGGGDDYVHPSNSRGGVTTNTGRKKVADQLFAFLKTDPTATPWFLRTTTTGLPPDANITSDSNGGQVPLKVTFQANASDPDGTIAQTLWTFDDGDYSLDQDPVKWFTAPGVYTVRLTVIDNSGNSIFRTKTITMTQ